MSDHSLHAGKKRSSRPPVRPVRLVVFVASAFIWMGVLVGVWYEVKDWSSYPVGVIAGKVLEWSAPSWISDTSMVLPGQPDAEADPWHLEVDTRVEVVVPGTGGQRAFIILDADPARYAYGLVIFLALLFAARQRGLVGKALLGYLALLPFQAFTVVFFVLQQILIATDVNMAQLHVNSWQVNGIIYGFQLGTLIVPTLVPVLLWLWMDRDFFSQVLVARFSGKGAAPLS